MRALLIATVVALGVAGVACGDDSDSTTVEETTTTTSPAEGRGGPEVDDVADLAEELEQAGIPCALEYEGLRDGQRELSRCTIGEEEVTLTVWDDVEELNAFAEAEVAGPGSTAIGPNWTIDAGQETTTASITDAVGGTLRGEGTDSNAQ